MLPPEDKRPEMLQTKIFDEAACGYSILIKRSAFGSMRESISGYQGGTAAVKSETV
jgi:hypothetical protein